MGHLKGLSLILCFSSRGTFRSNNSQELLTLTLRAAKLAAGIPN
jgi:hypothetical protein